MKTATVIDKESVSKHNIRRCSFKDFLEAIENDSVVFDESKQEYKDILETLKKSIVKFEKSAEMLESYLKHIEVQIVDIGLFVAKEVVAVQLNEHSVETALKLGSELIKELQNSSKIVFRVNPKDYEAVLEYFGQLNYVEIIQDKKVDVGGIVASNDKKKIDAQISKRFKKAKKVVMDRKNR